MGHCVNITEETKVDIDADDIKLLDLYMKHKSVKHIVELNRPKIVNDFNAFDSITENYRTSGK